MIYKEISGRLGNQMFQYAMARSIYEKSDKGKELVFNLKKGVYDRGFKNDLKYFNVLNWKEVSSYKGPIGQMIILNLYNFFEKTITLFCLLTNKDMHLIKYKCEKKVSPFLNLFGIYYVRQGYVSFKNYRSKNKYLLGYFESSKYFDDIRDILLKKFTPIFSPKDENIELYNYIKNEESCCVTIRRGDFVSNPTFKKNHYICTPDYFINSMKIMKKKNKNVKFIVFSDDVDWCRENIVFPFPVVFESGKDPVWEKLRLMYSCKNFILSNSTFSWWAQYLSRNENKIVIAPSRWINSGYSNDIYMKDWLIYDVDKKSLRGEK